MRIVAALATLVKHLLTGPRQMTPGPHGRPGRLRRAGWAAHLCLPGSY